jgi:hypothetical protein
MRATCRGCSNQEGYGGVAEQGRTTAQRISAGAYQALREALPVVFWYRRSFETYLRLALRDHPELLAGLNFSDVKRWVADELVDRLAQQEDRYQETTLQLMVEIASLERFPDLEKLENAEERLADARKAVAELRRWTERYTEAMAEQERLAAARAAAAQQAEAARRFADEIENLREQFVDMHAMVDVRQRGYAFQDFLYRLFALFDLEPRLGYELEHEQIDGSFSFDTDDYILEARWRKEPANTTDADRFAKKVERKGKNALGLFISINGFTSGVFADYRHSTPFFAMDGGDLMCVLDQRMRLDDLLRRKKRHANETGHCYFSARTMLGE